MPMPQLQTALLGADGRTPVKVTRVEIEILDNGQCRWTLWSDRRRLFTNVAARSDLRPMMQATSIVVEAEMAARQGGN